MFRQKEILLVVFVAVNIFVILLAACNSNEKTKPASCTELFKKAKTEEVCITRPEVRQIGDKKQKYTTIQMILPCGEAGQPPCQPPPETELTQGQCQIPRQSYELDVFVDSCNAFQPQGHVLTTYTLEVVFKTLVKK